MSDRLLIYSGETVFQCTKDSFFCIAELIRDNFEGEIVIPALHDLVEMLNSFDESAD